MDNVSNELHLTPENLRDLTDLARALLDFEWASPPLNVGAFEAQLQLRLTPFTQIYNSSPLIKTLMANPPSAVHSCPPLGLGFNWQR